MAYYQGKYTVKHRSKYKGNPDDVVYRSGWERDCFTWLDKNSDVAWWSSEEVVIPYICETDKRPHRYFVDLLVRFKNGRTLLIEVKPHKETETPAKQGKSKQRYLTEALTYVKNQSKWKAASSFAKDRGWEFVIWTEKELKSMGILKTVAKKPLKPLKKAPPFRKKKKATK